MMTDGTKAQVWAATWQAWGGSYSITGPQANDSRFPGQWFQLESGLHYNWHRHYDPSIGRYTQPDPLGFVDGPSVHGYVGGLPQGYVDPDGLFIRKICSILSALCNFQFDGPAPGLWHGNGRVFGVRYNKSYTICRIDFAPYPGTNNQSRLHGHFAPKPDLHRCLDPRGCVK
ncbi:MAG: RHS repeat-associated core domain-containing protein [Hyphomicrobiaceae bacterium]|nr:RHS repeat-associated core domain-containing protein [Hyphomicrobiaceae bacterium]